VVPSYRIIFGQKIDFLSKRYGASAFLGADALIQQRPSLGFVYGENSMRAAAAEWLPLIVQHYQ
jgi:hypothetical protein